MHSINVFLSLLVLVLFPITLLINKVFGEKIRKINETIAKINDIYFSNIQQTVSGVRDIKELGIKHKRYDLFVNILKEQYKYNIKNGITGTIMQSISQIASFASYAAVILLGKS